MEAWRSVWIDGEEWPYEISSEGRVRRRAGTEFGRPPFGDCLRVYSDCLRIYSGTRYRLIQLSRNGVVKTARVHRLVLGAFLGPCPEGYEANHKDGDKGNNSIENLEWVTSLENRKHATLNGLAKTYITQKERRHRIKTFHLTKTDTEAAAILGLSASTFGRWRWSIGIAPKNPVIKLSMEAVRKIRHRFKHGETQTSLAREFDVTQPTISLIVRGRTRRE